MKTMTKAQPKKNNTQFVMVTPELQITNEEVLRAYTKLVEVGVQLLSGFELSKYRHYVTLQHTLNVQNTNLLAEFVCHFYNITLSNSKQGKSYIFIDFDLDFITKFGGNLANRLLRQAYHLTQSEENTEGIEYCLRPNFIPTDVHNYFYKLTFNGETDIISISVADKAEVA